jgi:putative transposase
MNYRDYKQFAQDGYYHIYNRGNGKQDIFLDDEDRKFFLFRMKEYLHPLKTVFPEDGLQGDRVAESHTPYIRKELPPQSFSLLCYVLMPNHFHLLIRQLGQIPISKLIAKVCTSYSKYFNKKYERLGHLFQDKFKAVRIGSDAQLLWLSAYIHNNPLTAGLVKDLAKYPWSSYPDYVGLRQGTLCDKDFIIKMVESPEAYKKFAAEAGIRIKERKDLEQLLLDE